MMDESPISKLIQHATEAHAAVLAQREAARQVAQRAATAAPMPPQAPEAGQSGTLPGDS